MTVLAVGSAIAAAVDALPKIEEGITKIGEMLHADRSVVLTVQNYTKRTLTVRWTHHMHGTFAVTPSGIINPREANIFGSQSKAGSIGTGTEGMVMYGVEDNENKNLGLYIYWKNPAIGLDECTAFLCTLLAESPVAGGAPLFLPYPPDGALKVVATGGGGNENVDMRYSLLRNE